MILKFFEINKIDIEKFKCLLFYGKNDGFKNEIIQKILKKRVNISKFDQNEILENQNTFINGISSQSLFEKEKTIIIRRCTDKILDLIEQLNLDGNEDTLIILDAGNLEKKSKLRSVFEKNKNFIACAFYPDNEQTLIKIASTFFKEKKILISASNINLIVLKCNGDRGVLNNELNKLETFTNNGKKITTENIFKLINLIENFGINELIDNCLAKNKKKTLNILNENNYGNEDSILILRSLLNKSKRILKLSNEYQKNQNIELTISTAKPPVFWKEKEITKQQIYKSTPESLKKLIYDLNDLELLIKKNLNNSLSLLNNFLLEQASTKN